MSVIYCLLVLIYAYYGFRLATTNDRDMPYALHTHELNPSGSLESSTRLVVLTSVTWILFVSRAIYNFFVAFGQGAITIGSASGGRKQVNPQVFLMFFFWEIMPTFAVLFYFRKIPRNRLGRTWSCCWESRKPRLGSGVYNDYNAPISGDQNGALTGEDLTEDGMYYGDSPDLLHFDQAHRETIRELLTSDSPATFNNPLRYDTDTDSDDGFGGGNPRTRDELDAALQQQQRQHRYQNSQMYHQPQPQRGNRY
jgi:hypothetical protein